MTWTYDITTLGTSALTQVRSMIGDTATADQLLADEEIDWYITQEGSTFLAASRAAEAISAKYAREFDLAAGGVNARSSQMSVAYAKLAKDLRSRATSMVAPYAGGISVSDKAANAANTDRTPPSFWMGMEDNKGAPGPLDSTTLGQ